MPLYRTRPLANPYVGIDVGYYDKKLMQKQQRHDLAREAWSKNVASTAANAYQDEAGRKQYLQEQDKVFQDVLKKHSGNLSAGLHDVMGALEADKTNPYHNLNKTQMENIQMQRALQEKYGAEYIDQSKGLYDPLYQNGKWRDPSGIKAQGLQADNYDKILEDQFNELSPVLRDYVGHLKQEGTPGYLEAVRSKLKTLSPEMLQQLASDPRVHQSFLANAPTALQDTRQYGSTGQTFSDVLGSPQGFSNFFMGNLLDKVKDERTTTRQFVGDKSYDQRKAIERDKASEDYKRELDRVKEGNLYATQNLGEQTVNGESLDKMREDNINRQEMLSGLNENIAGINKEMDSLLNTKDLNVDPLKINIKTIKNAYSNLNGEDKKRYDLLQSQRGTLKIQKDKFDIVQRRSDLNYGKINDKIFDDFSKEYGDDINTLITPQEIWGGKSTIDKLFNNLNDPSFDDKEFLKDRLQSGDMSWLAGVVARTLTLGKDASTSDYINKLHRNYTVFKDKQLKEGVDIQSLNKVILAEGDDAPFNRLKNTITQGVKSNPKEFISSFDNSVAFGEDNSVLNNISTVDDSKSIGKYIDDWSATEGRTIDIDPKKFEILQSNSLPGGVEYFFPIDFKDGDKVVHTEWINNASHNNPVTKQAEKTAAFDTWRDGVSNLRTGASKETVLEIGRQKLVQTHDPESMYMELNTVNEEAKRTGSPSTRSVYLGFNNLKAEATFYPDGSSVVSLPFIDKEGKPVIIRSDEFNKAVISSNSRYGEYLGQQIQDKNPLYKSVDTRSGKYLKTYNSNVTSRKQRNTSN